MMYKTHVVYSLFMTILVLNYWSFPNPVLFFLMVIVGTLLVDIDSINSKFGKQVPFLSIFFEHRGFFHSFFAIIFYYFLLVFFNFEIYQIFGFLLGYVSHIIMDALTVKGIRPFYPLSKLKIKGFIKSGSLSEKFIFSLLVILIIFIISFKILHLVI